VCVCVCVCIWFVYTRLVCDVMFGGPYSVHINTHTHTHSRVRVCVKTRADFCLWSLGFGADERTSH